MSTLPNELANIRNLSSLTLGGNQFTILPTVIPLLTNLIRLDLSYNYWQAPFPSTMGNLRNLQALIAMSSNLQTAFGGSYFPEWLLSLTNLREIILDYNPTFGATLNATLGTLPELGYFSCVQCGLTGKEIRIYIATLEHFSAAAPVAQSSLQLLFNCIPAQHFLIELLQLSSCPQEARRVRELPLDFRLSHCAKQQMSIGIKQNSKCLHNQLPRES